MDYSFVKQLSVSNLTQLDLQRIKKGSVPGSHCDAILKESLLDRDYDISGLRERVLEISAKGEFILNSFPSILFANTNLLLRSEFLILQYTGSSCLQLGEVRSYIEKSVNKLLSLKPARIIYRFCDYNRNDFSFLKSGFFINETSAPMRGAELLVEEEDLFLLDVMMVKHLLEAGIPVDILIPFVQYPEQLQLLHERVHKHISCSKFTFGFGMMLEVPANLFQILDYVVADFFVFGPSDLTRYFYGDVDRNHWCYKKIHNDIILNPIQHAVSDINKLGNRKVYLAKQLLNLEEKINFTEYRNTIFSKLFMPNQLARPI
jgi:hypothetical protein